VAESGSKNGGMDVTLPPDPEGLAKSSAQKVSTAEFGPDDSGPDDAALEADLEVLTVGATVGRYIVVERLGAGAMGVVYAAYDPKLDRKVALKLLRRARAGGDHARRTARLEREAQAVAKLSHPNVVGIFDVLVYEDRVVLAMEYLGGGTLRAWMEAQKHPWREIVRMFIEVGKGLAAAHDAGQIHRDFKPDNVLLDGNGVPKVADFGLARVRSTTGVHKAVASDDEKDDLPLEISPSLTRTGAITGTPAYMAPEQFLGKEVDGRTDQFAFCVALYEALYGERPFAGETILALSDSVTDGRLRPFAKGTDVPAWVRAIVLRGLRVAPADRYPAMDQLIVALANDPIARRQRRLWTGAAVVALVAAGLTTRHYFLQRRNEIDRQATEQIGAANAVLADAGKRRTEASVLRKRAFAAFDGYDRDKAEGFWEQSLTAATAADAGYQRGIQHLEAAVALTPRKDLRDRIADVLVDYVQMPGRTESEREASLRRLSSYDEGGRRTQKLTAPATLQIKTDPPGISVSLESYDAETHRSAEPARPIGKTPMTLAVPRGSYRLSFEGTVTQVAFRDPVLLAPGETYEVSVRVPPRSAVPKDFVYVPAGDFLFGSDDESIRAVFLETVPLHSVRTEAFLISRTETTIADWIAFLETLPPAEREKRRPHGGREGLGGFIDVRPSVARGWEIRFRATNKDYRATQGEPFRYLDRDRRSSLDWMRFPVTGITPEDALEYVAWLNRSRRVPGARLCTEREWERAARGADGRWFPQGNKLLPDDANFDVTYGRQNRAYGFDEVGSHPASRSPFGVDDMLGNAWEITRSVMDRNQFVARGSSFYMCLKTLLSANRDPLASVTRDYTVGLRVCADASF